MSLSTEQTNTVVESLQESYKTMWKPRHTEGILAVLQTDGEVRMTELAERVRDFVWSSFTGGGVSANATRRAFAAIGHPTACNPNWI